MKKGEEKTKYGSQKNNMEELIMSQKMIYKSGKEQIVFDVWEKNEEFGGYWVDLCPDCIKKYQHLLDGKLLFVQFKIHNGIVSFFH